MQTVKTATFFAAVVAFVAGLLPASGQPSPENEEDGLEPVPNLANVCYIAESSRVDRTGRRATIVVLTNGTKLESDRTAESYGASWPVFRLSVTNGGPRHVFVNPAEVNQIETSNFRRTNRTRPDTVIFTTGDSVVVRESIDEVRRRLGR